MSVEDYALANGLEKVGARHPLLQYVKEAAKRVDFAYTMASYSNEAGNAKSRIGGWWNVLLPVIQATMYGLVFGLILGRNRPDYFLPFLFTGVFLFGFIQGSFTQGAGAIVSRQGLVRSLSFPRVLLPLSMVISQTITLLPQLLVLFVILLITQPISALGFDWLMIFPLIGLLFIFNFGLATTMARITVHIQDLNKLVPFISRIMFYVSGVFFSLEKIMDSASPFAAIIKLNPIFQFLTLARGYLVEGYPVDPWLWLSVTLWSIGLAAFGLVFFWRAEERYGREDK
jgi:teichoic acid transport system permease protein